MSSPHLLRQQQQPKEAASGNIVTTANGSIRLRQRGASLKRPMAGRSSSTRLGENIEPQAPAPPAMIASSLKESWLPAGAAKTSSIGTTTRPRRQTQQNVPSTVPATYSASAFNSSVAAKEAGGSMACTLTCVNGGQCEFVTDDPSTRAFLIQSGQMIQKCSCRPGFTGTACELVLEPCQDPGRCSNGQSCLSAASFSAYVRIPLLATPPHTSIFDRTASHNQSSANSTAKSAFLNVSTALNKFADVTCACAAAAATSRFAAYMCRHPYTEYCDSHYDHSAPSTPFCTNGGKCQSSWLAAQHNPWNTTANRAFAFMGCVCPDEFYGPHCELLQYGPVYQLGTGEDDGSDSNTTTGGEDIQVLSIDNQTQGRGVATPTGSPPSPRNNPGGPEPEDSTWQEKLRHWWPFYFVLLLVLLALLWFLVDRRRKRQKIADKNPTDGGLGDYTMLSHDDDGEDDQEVVIEEQPPVAEEAVYLVADDEQEQGETFSATSDGLDPFPRRSSSTTPSDEEEVLMGGLMESSSFSPPDDDDLPGDSGSAVDPYAEYTWMPTNALSSSSLPGGNHDLTSDSSSGPLEFHNV